MANALLQITGALALVLAFSAPTSTALSTVIKFEVIKLWVQQHTGGSVIWRWLMKELQNSLESDNPVLLIDVRSRRELVEDGQVGDNSDLLT